MAPFASAKASRMTMLQPFRGGCYSIVELDVVGSGMRVICCFPFDFELVNCDDAVGGRRLEGKIVVLE